MARRCGLGAMLSTATGLNLPLSRSDVRVTLQSLARGHTKELSESEGIIRAVEPDQADPFNGFSGNQNLHT